jgi:phospholipid/cholesterol/gamma-HCH transport system substrate-binding protein
LYLGLFFLVVIVVLGGYTLFLTRFTLFSEKEVLSIYFSNTSGLREGDAVQVAGMRWGTVEKLAYDPTADLDKRITVQISLDEPVTIHEDGTIVIKDATVLGGKILSIEPGMPSSPVWPEDRPYHGLAQVNVLDSLGQAVTDLGQPLEQAAKDLQAMVGDAKNGTGVLHKLVYDEKLSNDLSAAAEKISQTFDNTGKLSQDLVEGKGTLGKLFNDDKLYSDIEALAGKIQAFLDDGQGLIRDARQGEGLLPKLLTDATMAEDGRQFLASVRKVTDGLAAGEGTLGRLFQDPKIAEDIQKITSRLANGEGTLGRLFMEDEVYDNVKANSEDLLVTATNLREGNGPIGKLINDDELYVEFRRALKTLTGTLEEAREAAPISTLLNLSSSASESRSAGAYASPRPASKRSTHFPIRSTSTSTRCPSRALPRFVSASVRGITATSKRRPRGSITVRLTPSSVMLPLSVRNFSSPTGTSKVKSFPPSAESAIAAMLPTPST